MLKKATLLIIVFLIVSAGTVFAGNKPLELKSSEPENGAIVVAVGSAIVLEFSSNVVNMTIADNNRECFTLFTADGTELEIDVYLPDDQMEPENKRKITLTPAEALAPAAEYRLVISAGLLAKNGNALGIEQTITFTTE